jgi:serine/threonine protein kinase
MSAPVRRELIFDPFDAKTYKKVQKKYPKLERSFSETDLKSRRVFRKEYSCFLKSFFKRRVDPAATRLKIFKYFCPKRVIKDRYYLKKHPKYLGEGATSVILEIQEIATRRLLALKCSKEDCSLEVLYEAIEHWKIRGFPGVCEIIDHFPYGRGAYAIVLGKYKQDLYKRIKEKNGLDIEEVLALAKTLFSFTDALAKKRKIHADLKPLNIFFDGSSYKIGDMGLLTKVSRAGLGVLQTFSYRAPEVIFNSPSMEKIDIWSIGLILIEAYLNINLCPTYCTENSDENNSKLLQLLELILGPIPLDVIDGFLPHQRIVERTLFGYTHRYKAHDIKKDVLMEWSGYISESLKMIGAPVDRINAWRDEIIENPTMQAAMGLLNFLPLEIDEGTKVNMKNQIQFFYSILSIGKISLKERFISQAYKNRENLSKVRLIFDIVQRCLQYNKDSRISSEEALRLLENS